MDTLLIPQPYPSELQSLLGAQRMSLTAGFIVQLTVGHEHSSHDWPTNRNISSILIRSHSRDHPEQERLLHIAIPRNLNPTSQSASPRKLTKRPSQLPAISQSISGFPSPGFLLNRAGIVEVEIEAKVKGRWG